MNKADKKTLDKLSQKLNEIINPENVPVTWEELENYWLKETPEDEQLLSSQYVVNCIKRAVIFSREEERLRCQKEIDAWLNNQIGIIENLCTEIQGELLDKKLRTEQDTLIELAKKFRKEFHLETRRSKGETRK
jgi:uncharacterized protein YehS (DUF1456 family)